MSNNSIKYLPKGRPDGAQPIRQTKRPQSVEVLVSEHTRRIAHELDDRHRDWIMIRQKDELAEIEDSSPLDLHPNHAEWLIEYHKLEERYNLAFQRQVALQQRLSALKRDRRLLLRKYSAEQYYVHVDTLKVEWAYTLVLQKRLKQARAWARLTLQNAKARTPVLECENRVAALLAELTTLVYHAFHAEDLNVIRDGLRADNSRLDNAIQAALTESAHYVIEGNQDARLIVDGFLARRWEVEPPVDLSKSGM